MGGDPAVEFMEAPKGLNAARSGPIESNPSRSESEGRACPFRVDLHVHSHHSGAGHFSLAGPPLGYGTVEAIYAAAKRRGMDLVTLTDIDTIDGCLEFLERHPDSDDFFLSEEVTATDPRSGARHYVLVYDITEGQHREIARRRGDLVELMAYLHSSGIIAALGLFPGEWSTAPRDIVGTRSILGRFERCEIRNALCGAKRGRRMERLLAEMTATRIFKSIGGSGSHGPRHVGRTFTMSPALTREEFVADLRESRTRPGGIHGSGWRAAREQLRLLAHGYRALVTGSGRRRVRRTLGVAVAALPIHLSGLSVGGNAVRFARSSANLKLARRRLDRITVRKFRSKARSLGRTGIVADGDQDVGQPQGMSHGRSTQDTGVI